MVEMIKIVHGKTGSIEKTLTIVQGFMPSVTKDDVINIVSSLIKVKDENETKTKVTKSSAKIEQADAMSALYTFYSKMIDFEKECTDRLCKADQDKLRTILSEAFLVIKEI